MASTMAKTTTTTTTTATLPGSSIRLMPAEANGAGDSDADADANRPYPAGFYASLAATPDLPEARMAQLKAENYRFYHMLPHSYRGSTLPPLKEIRHVDVGTRADPAMPNLLRAPGAHFREMTPPLGTEVTGLQLTDLTGAQRDELALLVAQRGVLVFRNQNLVEQPLEAITAFGEYFGPLQTNQFGAYVKGHPGLTIVYRGPEPKKADANITGSVNTMQWHTDMSYELNPVGTTFLAHLEGPASGGDTVYANMVTAYERLSPQFRAFLDTLSAVHTGMTRFARNTDKTLLREPIDTVHPVVRTHPVTGKKSLWVNKNYVRNIVGLKDEESEAILNMLYMHVATGQDFHLRVHWEPGTVIAYDNRNTQHSALVDYTPGGQVKRHLLRIQPHAERPYH